MSVNFLTSMSCNSTCRSAVSQTPDLLVPRLLKQLIDPSRSPLLAVITSWRFGQRSPTSSGGNINCISLRQHHNPSESHTIPREELRIASRIGSNLGWILSTLPSHSICQFRHGQSLFLGLIKWYREFHSPEDSKAIVFLFTKDVHYHGTKSTLTISKHSISENAVFEEFPRPAMSRYELSTWLKRRLDETGIRYSWAAKLELGRATTCSITWVTSLCQVGTGRSKSSYWHTKYLTVTLR